MRPQDVPPHVRRSLAAHKVKPNPRAVAVYRPAPLPYTRGYAYEGLGLGLTPLSGIKKPSLGSQLIGGAVSAIPFGGLASNLVSHVPVIGGLFKPDKNPGRMQANQEAYNVAINGNGPYKDQPSGLQFLKVMSGSWATNVAKQDAANKYNQAADIINAQKAAKPAITASPVKPQTISLPNTPAPVSAGPKPPKPPSVVNQLLDFLQGQTNTIQTGSGTYTQGPPVMMTGSDAGPVEVNTTAPAPPSPFGGMAGLAVPLAIGGLALVLLTRKNN